MKQTLGLVAVVSILASANVALANEHYIYQSDSGNTVFPIDVGGGCAGDVFNYTTSYGSTVYYGTFWVESPPAGDRCLGGRKQLVGHFEEHSSDGSEQCQGQLTFQTSPNGGSYARWDSISPVPGYPCSGAGTSAQLPLNVVQTSW